MAVESAILGEEEQITLKYTVLHLQYTHGKFFTLCCNNTLKFKGVLR